MRQVNRQMTRILKLKKTKGVRLPLMWSRRHRRSWLICRGRLMCQERCMSQCMIAMLCKRLTHFKTCSSMSRLHLKSCSSNWCIRKSLRRSWAAFYRHGCYRKSRKNELLSRREWHRVSNSWSLSTILALSIRLITCLRRQHRWWASLRDHFVQAITRLVLTLRVTCYWCTSW